mmetsp:Transcript_6723/g.12208  ORF Transcript_6723/g.12208 Transcript_6723/m.12208 type:complete len:315 (-) Transcript_6723:38-982(-)
MTWGPQYLPAASAPRQKSKINHLPDQQCSGAPHSASSTEAHPQMFSSIGCFAENREEVLLVGVMGVKHHRCQCSSSATSCVKSHRSGVWKTILESLQPRFTSTDQKVQKFTVFPPGPWDGRVQASMNHHKLQPGYRQCHRTLLQPLKILRMHLVPGLLLIAIPLAVNSSEEAVVINSPYADGTALSGQPDDFAACRPPIHQVSNEDQGVLVLLELHEAKELLQLIDAAVYITHNDHATIWISAVLLFQSSVWHARHWHRAGRDIDVFQLPLWQHSIALVFKAGVHWQVHEEAPDSSEASHFDNGLRREIAAAAA